MTRINMSLNNCFRYSKVWQSYAFDRPGIARLRPSVSTTLNLKLIIGKIFTNAFLIRYINIDLSIFNIKFLRVNYLNVSY